MTERHVQISNSSGQIQVGDGNTMSQLRLAAGGLTDEQVRTLLASIDGLRALAAGADAPEATRQAADERLGGLVEEIEAPSKESPRRLRRLLTWFEDNLPQLAGAVGTLIGGPLIGTLLHSAGLELAGPEDAD